MNHSSKFYLITPEYTASHNNYLASLELSLQNGVKLVQLRCKQLPQAEFIVLALKVVKLVHYYGGKLILNGAPSLLDKVEADGVHLPSSLSMFELQRPISKQYILSVACHNEDQIRHAEKIEADLIVLSPVFATPCSPDGIPLGWDKFAEMTKLVKIPVYALGGLTPLDYHVACLQGAYGIAAIRSLWAFQQAIHF